MRTTVTLDPDTEQMAERGVSFKQALNDVNVLHAVDSDADRHERSRRWMDSSPSGAASAVLSGINGSTGEWQVRTAQDVPGFTRRASTDLDVRSVRRPS